MHWQIILDNSYVEESLKNWFVGTSGFQFEDWIGTVYPEGIKKSEVFEYYCKYYGFNSVELNSTFYAIPGFRSIEKLLSRAPSGFKFAVKIHGSVTHEKRFDELWKFFEVSKLFMEQDKFLCYLAQFPYSFKMNSENVDFLHRLKEHFMNPDLLYIEIRHDSWNSFAQENSDLNFVLVDLPPLPHLPKFSDWVRIVRQKKQNMLYVRFHGRNKNWYEAGEKERYNYLYSKEELSNFAKEIIDLSYRSNSVFFNNCFLGQALKNAFDFRLTLPNL